MKMIEKDTADEDSELDDMFTIDWSETAYLLPEPNLITEKSFNFYTRNFPCYKDYFDFMRISDEMKNHPDMNLASESTGKSDKLMSTPTQHISGTPLHPTNTHVHQPNTRVDPSNIPVHPSDTTLHPPNNTAHPPNPPVLPSNTTLHPPKTTAHPPTTIAHPSNTPAIPSSSHQSNVPLRPNISAYLSKPGTFPPQPKPPMQLPSIASKVGQKSGPNCTTYHLSLPEPRCSNINSKDRRFYHAFMKNKNNSAEKPENHTKMKELLAKIRHEQEEYQQFLHHCASVDIKNYLFLSEDIRKHVIERVHNAIQKLIRPPQKLFKPLRVLNFSNMTGVQNPTFTFIRRVCEQGVFPKFTMPSLAGKLTQVISSQHDIKRGMSDDMVQSMLMTEHGHVYIHQDSLLAIMEALVSPTREYVLPVNIKEIKINEDEKRTVAVLESPLPRRQLSTRDVNKSHYDNILIHRHGSSHSKPTANENQPGVPGEDPESEEECDDLSTQIQVNLFSLRDLCVLVETRPGEQDEGSQKTFHVASKCEYQVSLGFEQFSIIDLCQLWWNSKMENTDHIVCTRVDVRHDVVARNDMYTRDVLCPPACPYNPYVFCNHLYHIIKELQSLPPGSYLAEHLSGSQAINIHQETDSGSVSFEMMYRSALNSRQLIVDSTSPWLPIDTTILPKGFALSEHMACLFSVKHTQNNQHPNSSRGRGRARGGNKKKRRGSHFDEAALVPPGTSLDSQGSDMPLNNKRTITTYQSGDF